MKNYRIYTPQTLYKTHTVILEDNGAHHYGTVLKLTSKDWVTLFNAHSGEWRATLTKATHKQLTFSIEQCMSLPHSLPTKVVYVSPVKAQSDVIIWASSLGATHLIPVICERTITQFKQKKAVHTAISSTEQNGRLSVLTFGQPVSLSTLARKNQLPVLWAIQNSHNTKCPHCTAVLVGPEGGFTQKECVLLEQNPLFYKTNLASFQLRTELAVGIALHNLL